MFNAKNILAKCLLAVALAGSALSAMAAVTNSYHVDVNTTGLSGTGALDFYLASSSAGALPLTVTLSNFSADFGAPDPAFSGDYTANADGSFSLNNGAGYNYLSRFLSLGNTVGFDVAFSGAFLDTAGPEGGLLSVALFNELGANVGSQSGIAIFDLAATAPTTFTITAELGLATVTAISPSAVPEPSALLLMLTGLGLAGFVKRRRQGAAQ